MIGTPGTYPDGVARMGAKLMGTGALAMPGMLMTGRSSPCIIGGSCGCCESIPRLGGGAAPCGVALPYMRLNIAMTSISGAPGGGGGFGPGAPPLAAARSAGVPRLTMVRLPVGIILRRVRCSFRCA